MRKLLKSIACFATAAFVGASALADGLLAGTGAFVIGGISYDCTAWSTSGDGAETDLGYLGNLTLSGVGFDFWSDSSHGGANMFIQLWDANGNYLGGQDSGDAVWLGESTYIGGDYNHDYRIAWSGALDASFGNQLVEGSVYYLDVWFKTYGDGDVWYPWHGGKYHTKFVYLANPQKVTFDANGGQCDILNCNYEIGVPYGELPVPTKEGSALIGWFDADTGERVKAKHDVPDQPTRTLEAQWGAPQTVTFDPGDGECDVTTMVFAQGGKYEDMPGATLANHTFAGWYDASTGERAKNYYPVTEESTRTLVAHWRGLKQTVHFDAGEGTCTPSSVQCFIGETYTGFPAPVLAGQTFVGWYDDDTGIRYKNYSKPVTDASDLYLTAHWKGARQTVHFDAGDGQCDKETVQCYIGESYIGFPLPVWEGHTFRGWFDETGTRYKNYTKPVTDAADLYLSARWQETAPAAAAASLSLTPRAKAGARDVTTATDTITAGILAATSTTYAEFSGVDKTKDGINSDAVYAGKNSKNSNGAMQLRISDNSSGIVTTGSGGSAKSVTVVWQTTPGSDSGLYVYGKTSSYAAATDLYDSSKQGTLLGTITDGTPLAITGDYTYIGLKSKKGTVYPSSIAIEWAVASSAQSVTLSPAGPIEAEVGDEVIITATADGFSGDVTWSWTGNGTPDGNRFTVDTSSAFEAATITATATYGTDETASQSVTVTVTAPKHAITIDSTIQNGTVTTDPEDEAAEGATVTVTASPASGYKLGSITVNGDELEAGVTTFTMPAEDVIVSATFVELSGDVLTQANTTTTSGYTSWTLTGASGTKYAGISAGGNSSIQLNTATTASKRGIVITESTGRNVASVTVDWNENTGSGRSIEIYGRTEAYDGPADLHGDDPGDLLGELKHDDGDTTLNVTGDYPYIGIVAKGGALYLNSVTIEFAPVAAIPTVTVTASATEVLVDTEVTFTATAENFDAPASDLIWEWKVGETVDPTQDGTTFTWTPSAAGTYTVTATATDGDNIDDDSVTITVTAPPALHDVVVMTDGNGTAEADVDEALPGTAVTVTATPNADCRLDAITVNDEPITGTTFEMPNVDVLVYVTFEAKHDIEVFAGDHGQASADKDKAYADETVTLTVTPDDGYTLDAITVNDGEVEVTGNTFVMPKDDAIVEVTFKEKPAGFEKITSLDQLTAGEYVITGVKAAGEEYAMKAEVSTTSTKYILRRTDAVTIEDGAVTDATDDIIWTLAKDLDSGDWTIYNSAVGYVFWASGNSANAQATTSDNSYWTISLNSDGDGTFAVKNAETPARNLRYNTNSGQERFAAYQAGSSGTLTGSGLNLYKKPSAVPSQTVTFDPNGGECEPLSATYVIGEPYGSLPTPTLDGFALIGWFDADTGERVKAKHEVPDQPTRTLEAQWGAPQTVTFDPGEGECDVTTMVFAYGGKYEDMPGATWENHTFAGWYDATTGERAKNYYPVTEESTRTLVAQWRGLPQTVHFDAGEGQCDTETVQCYIGGTYTGFPMPTWEGHTFVGWFDENGTRYKNYTKPVTDASDLYLTAEWKGLKQTVHFDAGEGQCDKETVQCFIGETYIGFPAATRDGYVFRGWFDENGTRYKNYTKPVTDAADLYLTASWKESASASSLAITAFEMKPRAASPASRSAAPATVESTLWFGTYAGTVYEVQWAPAVGGEWIVLKRWTAEEDGEMPVTVDVPAGPTGFFRLVEIAD